MSRAFLSTRLAAALVSCAAAVALAARMAGFETPTDSLTGHGILGPVESLAFLLAGLLLWFGARRPSPRTRVLMRILPLAFSLAGAAALFEPTGIGRHFLPPGTAAGLLAWGGAMFLLDTAFRRLDPSQFLAAALVWGAFLSVVNRMYGASVESSRWVPYLLTFPAAVLFLLLTAGFLVARPGKGIVSVFSSRFSGGSLARRILPLVVFLPFTVGWIRLQGYVLGHYDTRFGFALFACSNIMIFAAFIWLSARSLNRIDGKRQRAYESLRASNQELRHLNEALQSEIGEHTRTESARRDMELQLFQSQKMEAMGTLASGIAHDFNNILTVILLNAENAEESAPAGDAVRQNLREIRKSGSRAADLVRQIMTFGRRTEGHPVTVRLEEVVREALEMLRHSLPAGVEVRCVLDASTPAVMADWTQVQQVLLNLGTNAAHAMADGGVLEIRSGRTVISAQQARYSADLREGTYAHLAVSDTGHGMDESILKQIFDPFFTTKPPGKGTGLGLSVVHGILKLHEGAVMVRSRVGEGSVFNLYFPAAEKDSVTG